MPHDCKGTELKKGDEVIMRFKVDDVYPTETACNVTMTAVDPIEGHPVDEYHPQLTCNTKLTEKISG